jgi:hypothetical protein
MSGISLPPNETSLTRIIAAIIALARGASNSVGVITLLAGQTSTTVDRSVSPAAENVAPGMKVFLFPETANAAAIVTSTYVSSVGIKTFTVTHPNTTNSDQTFAFEARG